MKKKNQTRSKFYKPKHKWIFQGNIAFSPKYSDRWFFVGNKCVHILGFRWLKIDVTKK